MNARSVAAVVLSVAYWAVMLMVALLAIGAPCGLAPDERCELEGPPWFGTILEVLGPLGTLLIAAMIYAALVLLSRRQ